MYSRDHTDYHARGNQETLTSCITRSEREKEDGKGLVLKGTLTVDVPKMGCMK